MPTTNSALLVTSVATLVGSTVQAAGAVVPLNASNANQVAQGGGGTRIDRVVTDLSTAGYAKNGGVALSLTGTTLITLDLTALAAKTGVVVGGDAAFANFNQLVFTNTGAADVAVAPDGTNGYRGPTLTVPAGSSVTWQSLAGLAVDSTHKIIDFTPVGTTTLNLGIGGS